MRQREAEIRRLEVHALAGAICVLTVARAWCTCSQELTGRPTEDRQACRQFKSSSVGGLLLDMPARIQALVAGNPVSRGECAPRFVSSCAVRLAARLLCAPGCIMNSRLLICASRAAL